MPQPVDFQTELGRTNAAERIQQIADRASLAAQQRQAAEAASESTLREQQISETPEAQSEEIDSEMKRRNPFGGRRRRRRDDTEQGDEDTVYDASEKTRHLDDPEGRRLDISI